MYGEVVTNDNGARLIDLCNKYELKIINSYFPTKTWIDLNGIYTQKDLIQ